MKPNASSAEMFSDAGDVLSLPASESNVSNQPDTSGSNDRIHQLWSIHFETSTALPHSYFPNWYFLHDNPSTQAEGVNGKMLISRSLVRPPKQEPDYSHTVGLPFANGQPYWQTIHKTDSSTPDPMSAPYRPMHVSGLSRPIPADCIKTLPTDYNSEPVANKYNGAHLYPRYQGLPPSHSGKCRSIPLLSPVGNENRKNASPCTLPPR